jgi:hypothetical protein
LATARGWIFAGAAASLALFGCSTASLHPFADYAAATAVDDPDGSLTTIVGPATKIVDMTSTIRFPQGDGAEVHSALFYVEPAAGGSCRFRIGYVAKHTFTVVKSDPIDQPCDGKRWARFRIAGQDVGFVAHLMKTNYKGTPVTLLEIGDHKNPDALRVVY